MKELTVVVNAQITTIGKIPDDKEVKFDKQIIAAEIKEDLNVDDVVIEGIKVFEMEVKEDELKK